MASAYHHDAPADQVAQRAGEEGAEQVPDERRAGQQAGLLIREAPPRRHHREDEGDHRPIHRVEGVAEPTHPQQAPVEPAEGQALHAPERVDLGERDLVGHRLFPPWGIL